MNPPSTARTAGRSDRAERRFRRQPFILLSFSSPIKLRKAQQTQSYQRFPIRRSYGLRRLWHKRPTRRNRGLPALGHSTALCCQRNSFCSAMLLYTYISRFSVNPHYQQQLYLRPPLVMFFNFLHKRPTFAFTSESVYTLGFPRKIAHKGTHGETGGVSDGALLLPSDRSTRFGNPAWPGIRTAYFAAFGF